MGVMLCFVCDHDVECLLCGELGEVQMAGECEMESWAHMIWGQKCGAGFRWQLGSPAWAGRWGMIGLQWVGSKVVWIACSSCDTRQND